MVNETTIYSALQNLPYATELGNYDEQTAQNLLVLPAGKYEIKITGAMNPDATTGSRQIRLGSFVLLEWNNSSNTPQIQQQEVTINVNLAGQSTINGQRPGTLDAPPVSYVIQYRTTPSLNLISKGELDQKNQELLLLQEQMQQQKEDHNATSL